MEILRKLFFQKLCLPAFDFGALLLFLRRSSQKFHKMSNEMLTHFKLMFHFLSAQGLQQRKIGAKYVNEE